MKRVLVYQSVTEGRVSRASLEVLSYCRGIAERMGAELAALVIHTEPEQFVENLGTYGADRVILVKCGAISSPINSLIIAALELAVNEYEPNLIVFANSETVKDFLGAVAIRVGAAAFSDVVSIETHDDFVSVSRPVQAARFLAHSEAQAKRYLISIRPGTFEAVPQPVAPEVTCLELDIDSDSLRFSVEEKSNKAPRSVDLSDAEIVIAAGRGVKDVAAKEMIETLANKLGGAIGSTRAAVEAGLFPASTQIGQTGKVVAPKLYIGIGISGAIQHVAGIINSRVIVAINKDPEAPIFEIATYGIVGDLYQVLPRLVERIKRFRS